MSNRRILVLADARTEEGRRGWGRSRWSRVQRTASVCLAGGLLVVVAGCGAGDSATDGPANPVGGAVSTAADTGPGDAPADTLAGSSDQDARGVADGGRAVPLSPDASDLVVADGGRNGASRDVSGGGASTGPQTTGPEDASRANAGSASSRGPTVAESEDVSKRLLGVRDFREMFRDQPDVVYRRWQAKLFSDDSRINHGGYVEYYSDGKTVFEKGRYVDGQRNGEWTSYHANGKLAKQGSYKLGTVHGPWKKYDNEGRLAREESYDNGKRDGTWVVYADGTDRVLRKIDYKNDLRHGKVQEWYEDGTMSAEATFVDGERDGPQRLWHPNGQLASEVHYEQGRRHGMARSWNEDGTLVDEKEFRNGILAAGS